MRVGIIGGGQLARMMALSAIPMGIEFSFLLRAEETDDCVKYLGVCVKADSSINFDNIYQEMLCPDVITIESEQVNLEWVEALSKHCQVHPNIDTIKTLKNRIGEKSLLTKLNIPTAQYFSFHAHDELIQKSPELNFPFVIKSATEGYDGKNQYIVKEKKSLEGIELSNLDSGYIAESFVNFKKEISFIAARSSRGEIKFYPATENIHKNSILAISIAPARDVSQTITDTGQEYLTTLMNELNYVGVLAMECFQIEHEGQESIMINELAPRVHNSGHWTQNGSLSSQFENHIRAILGLKLGSTENISIAGMVNVLGEKECDLNFLSEKTTFHWYNKQKRANRKMGHINILANNYEELLAEIEKVSERLS